MQFRIMKWISRFVCRFSRGKISRYINHLMVISALSSGQIAVSLQIEEVVVTAQKKEESISKVSVSITAITGSDLKDMGVSDTRDLGNIVPGFSFTDSGYSIPIYTLRGVGFNDTTQTASSTVGVYVDEVVYPYPSMTKGANLDIARVEILKGPQGTLFGRNTTGGAINYIVNKPGRDLEYGFEAAYSSYKTTEVEGYISGALTESIAARLAFKHIESSEPWQYSLTRHKDDDGELGLKDRSAGRLLFEWDASEKLVFMFAANWWVDTSDPQAGQPIAITPQNTTIGAIALAPDVRDHPLVDMDTDNARVGEWARQGVYGFDWGLDENFESLSGRVEYTINDYVDMVALTSYHHFYSVDSAIPQSALSVYNGERVINADTESYDLEIRFSGVAFEDFDWLIGGYSSSDVVDEVQNFYIATASNLYPLPNPDLLLLLGGVVEGEPKYDSQNIMADRAILRGKQDAETFAVFGNVGWRMSDEFKVSVGARYTDELREYNGCTQDDLNSEYGLGFPPAFTFAGAQRGSLTPAQPGECQSIDENGDSGEYVGTLQESNESIKITFDWTPTEELLIFASLSRGFKSGSFPIVTAALQSQLEPVVQEKLIGPELGLKWALHEYGVNLNAAVFHYDYDNKQLISRVLDPIFGPLSILANAPKSELDGAEVELQLSPFEGFFASISASYLDSYVIEYSGKDPQGQPQDFKGSDFNDTPQWEYTVLLNYEFSLFDDMLAAVGMDVSYTDESNASLGKPVLFEKRAYTLVNGRMSLSSDDSRSWKVGIFGRNLSNEYYVQGVVRTADATSRYAGMPRTYGVSFEYNYF